MNTDSDIEDYWGKLSILFGILSIILPFLLLAGTAYLIKGYTNDTLCGIQIIPFSCSISSFFVGLYFYELSKYAKIGFFIGLAGFIGDTIFGVFIYGATRSF